MEKEIEQALPDKFALVIDGWSEVGSSAHYVGVYAFFRSKAGQTKYFFWLLRLWLTKLHTPQKPFGIDTKDPELLP